MKLLSLVFLANMYMISDCQSDCYDYNNYEQATARTIMHFH